MHTNYSFLCAIHMHQYACIIIVMINVSKRARHPKTRRVQMVRSGNVHIWLNYDDEVHVFG